MTMEGQIVFDGRHLRGVLFNGDAPKMIVTFRQRVTPDGEFNPSAPVKGFVRRNYAHLHLQSRHNDWYINAETEAFERKLAEISARYRRVVSSGFSMGGYAALRFSSALNLRHCILVSPQISIAPDEVPWDRRYREDAGGFDPILGDVARRAQRKMRGALLVDPFRPLDMRHAKRIQAIFPNLRMCRLAGGGHPATRVIGESIGFGRVQQLLLSGVVDPKAIIQMHRDGRRVSPTYWRHLSEMTEGRGKDGASAVAHAQRAAIAAKTQ